MKEYPIDVHTVTKKTRGKDRFASWSSKTSLEVKGVGYKGCDTVVGSKDFTEGDTAYIVFIGWGTGDSFGRSENSSYEGIHLFESKTLAEMLFWKIHLDYLEEVDYMQSKQINYSADNQDMMTLNSNDWKGYFESVDTLMLAECRVGEPYFEHLLSQTPTKNEYASNENLRAELTEKIKNLSIIREKEILNSDVDAATPGITFKI